MTVILQVTLSDVRPLESVTLPVNVISPAVVSVPVVSVLAADDHPPPAIWYDWIVEPYAPVAPESVSFALPMPLT